MDNSRTEILLGNENMQKIASKHITIVGTGGVGGNVAIFLARAGIEKFTLIDFDKVSSSNINRQVVAFEDTIGEYKVDVLSKILQKINKNVQILCKKERISENNVQNLINNTDLVVDAIDSVKDKAALIIYCKRNNISIISAMGAGNRFDEPKFYLTDIYKTHDDGLAKNLRKILRQNEIKSLSVITCNSIPQKFDKVIGSISYYPAMCAGTMSAVIINKIIKGELWNLSMKKNLMK